MLWIAYSIKIKHLFRKVQYPIGFILMRDFNRSNIKWSSHKNVLYLQPYYNVRLLIYIISNYVLQKQHRQYNTQTPNLIKDILGFVPQFYQRTHKVTPVPKIGVFLTRVTVDIVIFAHIFLKNKCIQICFWKTAQQYTAHLVSIDELFFRILNLIQTIHTTS